MTEFDSSRQNVSFVKNDIHLQTLLSLTLRDKENEEPLADALHL